MWNRIQYWIQHRPKTMLFFIFLLTVFIRLPQLTRPLSKHHELNTAAVLVCLKAWDEKGLITYHGAPVQYYNTAPGDVFEGPAYSAPRLNRSGAYMSLGPGSYLLPWVCMHLLHLQPSIFFIRFFSLVLQFVSTLILFRLLLYFRRNFFPEKKQIPFIGSLFFLTAPAILWFMGNSYSHESMVIPFFLLMLLYGFKILDEKTSGSYANYGWYMLFAIVTIYIDWLGVFAAFVFFIKGIVAKSFRNRYSFLIITAFAVLIPVSTVLWQYISLVGWHDYSQLFIGKMGDRGLPAMKFQNAFFKYLFYFIIGYGLVLIPAINSFFRQNKSLRNHLFTLAAIPFLHYVVFIGFSGEHDYSILKWSPFIMLTAVAGWQSMRLKKRKLTVIAVVLSSFIIYELVNLPFTNDYKGEKYSWMKDAGNTIRQTAAKDEYIFTNIPVYYHQIEWYAGRNFRPVADIDIARKELHYQSGSKGIYYEVNERNQIVKIIRLTRQ